MGWTATPRLTTDPAAAKIPSMTVVITLNGAVHANDQCAGGEQGGEPQPHGAVQVTVSFSGGGSPISTTTDGISDTTASAIHSSRR